jgi:hypothetical protein
VRSSYPAHPSRTGRSGADEGESGHVAENDRTGAGSTALVDLDPGLRPAPLVTDPYSPSSRAMSMSCTSVVPSPTSRIFESR